MFPFLLSNFFIIIPLSLIMWLLYIIDIPKSIDFCCFLFVLFVLLCFLRFLSRFFVLFFVVFISFAIDFSMYFIDNKGV